MKRLLFLALAPIAAQAWDPAGHMLVDQIAWAQTKPEAREKVAELVQHLDSRFNENTKQCLVPMGMTSENVAERFKISRAAQDAFAVESHKRAAAARDGG